MGTEAGGEGQGSGTECAALSVHEIAQARKQLPRQRGYQGGGHEKSQRKKGV